MMRKSIAPAKITRPVISSVYLRKRLFRLLDKGLQHKATWVNGPPGSGKTTLVSSYIESKNITCIWYQVDYSDNDPATFFHYLALAAKGLVPGRRNPLPHFTPEYRGGLLTFTRNFFHELFRRIPNPYLLVLDNLQEVFAESTLPFKGRDGVGMGFSDESGFLDVLCAGLAEAPEGCSTILISRTAPPPTLARLCVNQEIKVVSRD